jgi:hypothetical protein
MDGRNTKKQCRVSVRYLGDCRYSVKLLDEKASKQYGVTITSVNRLLSLQRHACMLCGKPETYINPRSSEPQRLSIDHNHSCCPPDSSHRVKSCGKCIRSFLCRECNIKLAEVESFVRTPTDAERVYLRMWELIHVHAIPVEQYLSEDVAA